MAGKLAFEAPGWGSWTQDPVHFPKPVTALTQEAWAYGFPRGFDEAFELFGVPATMSIATVHGYVYGRRHVAGQPGPDGEVDAEQTAAWLDRCARAAVAAFEQRVWRDVLHRWDAEVKPAALATHLALGAVDLGSLDDAGLATHLEACVAHFAAMVYQHHRFNTSAMVPVADFAVHAAGWTKRPPPELLGLFAGASPVSGTWSDEIASAAKAIAADTGARAMLDSGGDPAEVVAALRARRAEVDSWVRLVSPRLVDGFDIVNPTLGEAPELLLGKLRAAVRLGGPPPDDTVLTLESELRALVPAEHIGQFDDLLAEARHVYRLRDERGVYSDTYGAGLLRLALLELGRRLVARGHGDDPTLVLDATSAEVRSLAEGASTPTADDLAARRGARLAAGAVEPPPLLGPPAGPPSLDGLHPAVLRMGMGMGFIADAMGTAAAEPSPEGPVLKGASGSAGVYEGRARVVHAVDDLIALEDGDVLVAVTTTEACNCVVPLLGAIVTDQGGPASHAAIVAREAGIPAVVGTLVATRRITDGARVRVDGAAGEVTLLP